VSPKVNAMLQKVLTVWAHFLNSEDSLYVLNTTSSGWLSSEALAKIHIEEFIHDADKAFYGFKSWNDFFIRQFKPGMRPIAEPANRKAIVNACESAPFAISTNVKEYDTFWIKSQPYSLRQMLNGKHVQEFIGGTIYQAFLSAENYHRWHSPVAGTIRSIHQVEGTYYAEAASEAFDESGPNNSQGYTQESDGRFIGFDKYECSSGHVCNAPPSARMAHLKTIARRRFGLDRREQECSDEDDDRNIQNS
jgi:phosphatidylserine decarboxylase